VRERLEVSARAPFASIVIATRERPDGLAATLDTVLALEYPRFEIIVVDNANTTDRTRSLLELHYADVPNLSTFATRSPDSRWRTTAGSPRHEARSWPSRTTTSSSTPCG
jgi:glycosyltransferase involved in cell wall biosynthesis